MSVMMNGSTLSRSTAGSSLQEWAAEEILVTAAAADEAHLEPHADWNMLMRSGALDTQGLLEVFFGGVTAYPGDTITFTLENGTVVGPVRWEAIYLGPPSTGPLQTGGDFYNFFVLGFYPASYEEPDLLDTPSSTTSAYPPEWNAAYPTPEVISQDHPDDAGLPQVFFLTEASVAVLSITQFTAYGDTFQQFIDIVRAFLTRSREAGLKKVVIDVQQNTGGQPFLAIEVFKLFFPTIDSFSGSRRRAHPKANALGDIISRYWEGLALNQSDYYYLSTNEWVITNRLDAITGEEYPTWDGYFLSTTTYRGDNFTNIEQYNLTNTFFTEEASGITIDNLDGSGNQPYSADDIIILSDGICSSACALFMELMHHEAQVRTVAMGDRPDYTPMQAPSGTRGAAVYDTHHMDIDISGALAIDNSTSALPLTRRHDFLIQYASVNLRDQIRRDDPSNTPLQFRYEAADCRIFYTPKTWYNYTNLWNYAADAAWHNSTLCIANSFHTQSAPTIFKLYTAESNSNSLRQSDEEENPQSPDHVDDPSNDILAQGHNIGSLAGAPCKSDCECGGHFRCREVNICQNNGEMKTRKQCVSHCQVLGRNSQGCPSGYHCQAEGVKTHQASKVSRNWRSQPGYCVPHSCYKVGGMDSESSLFPVRSNTNTGSGGTTDNSGSISCLKNWFGYTFHCFRYGACTQRCHLQHVDSGLVDDYTICTNTELNQWRENPKLERSDYGYGSVVYWDPEASSPWKVIFHNYEEAQFMTEL
ncbi:hypothetical protein BDV12DRAFT_204153 [Aspergillus spectabilis]